MTELMHEVEKGIVLLELNNKLPYTKDEE